jgi:hypothetical protein
MPDESQAHQLVRGIDWRSTFPFTQIFRSFRIAIHPSKLLLALLALLLIYTGGRFMDWLWLATPQHRAVPDEMVIYETTRSDENAPQAFSEARRERYEMMDREFKDQLAAIGKQGGDLDDLKWNIVDRREKEVAAARDAYGRAPRERIADAERERDRRIKAAYDRAVFEYERAAALRGVGLFKTFYDYQVGQVNRIVNGVGSGNWIGHGGVIQGVVNFFSVGPLWAARHHYVYFTIFGLFFLSVWSIFGGAIARIAAVHVARDEKISIRQALAFSVSKFLSFLSAPIIPLLIILLVGLVVAAGGFLLNVPHIGPIIVGALFFLALAAGFVMSLVLIGTIGGFNLMYPTIAVEGSDSFDAISRSFSYLYARPWRLVFYTAVALLYGALCYLFVKYFIFLMLALTHYFTGLLTFWAHANNTDPLWPTMWRSPFSSERLSYDIEFLTLSGGEDLGAFLLAFWVYLTIAMLGAFAISLYFSANTIIYFLMRNEVDATELDDVYVEQGDDEFADTAGAETTTVTTTSETSVTSTPGESSAVETARSDEPERSEDNPPTT